MLKKIISDKENIRIDKFLVDSDLGFSRSTIKKMIDNGFILVNNDKTKANYLIKVDDIISIEEMILDDREIVAQDIDLDIVYQDDDIVVINKPSGMVVHPGAGQYKDTLVNGLMYHIKDLSRINGEIRPGIVHRIDKETSGLLVVAKNDVAHQKLAAQLSDKTLYRVYLALVQGQILDKNIIIDAPIGRDEKDRTKMAITSKNSRDAITKVKVLEVYDSHSYIEAQLETGRTHQIRVHMNYIKHPIVGDPKYGYKKEDKSFGQYLHAYKLGLIHPTTGEYMEFEAALPKAFIEKKKELSNEKSED